MKSLTITTVVAAAGLALLAGAPLAQARPNSAERNAQRGQLTESDYRFAAKAARSGLEEVQAGELAQQKAADPAVRSFGERMVADHSKANDELKRIAAQKGATLPQNLSHHEHSMVAHLQGLGGANFDKTYAKDMLADHRKDVEEFAKEAKEVKDPDLRAWAQKTLPILQEHLRLAEQMQMSAKNK